MNLCCAAFALKRRKQLSLPGTRRMNTVAPISLNIAPWARFLFFKCQVEENGDQGAQWGMTTPQKTRVKQDGCSWKREKLTEGRQMFFFFFFCWALGPHHFTLFHL